ncbi:MBL fold metallo-hydrolase [Albimonas sp. CAU 1670]|uniref:MBL fold metallo-hydrolase n=1 Tax=Albimonas sp. CAU 1670 TaxID=3032599 RepID=UPI0023DA9160|nr:MBL fold metallo-hydrolase [Albimonas sp. CAU 1670]MDF2233040.1 MBL fold metallo-hydrolase [Albimonas sp. CAU 1670]
MAELRFTILGCGSSGGVPRLGDVWGACDPQNPKNRRRRCSMLVERIEDGQGITRVLIDTGPDMREQLLSAGVGLLDGVIYTHEHADHIHGLDDLRMIVFNKRKRLTVWANPETQDSLISRFGYAFVQPEGSPYPPILNLKTIAGPVTVWGDGGDLVFRPFKVRHGSIDALGFRIGPLAYLPDVSAMSDEAWTEIEGADTWVVDALRYTPHPTHSHLEQTLGWIEKSGVRRGVLTNMHVDLDFERMRVETPENVEPAHDGMVLTFAD